MINPKRVVHIAGSLNMDLAEKVIDKVGQLAKQSAENIQILIYSGGGKCRVGFALYDFFVNAIGRERIEMFAFGSVESMAPLVFLAGGKRYIGSDCHFWFHHIGRYTQDNFRLDTWRAELDLKSLKRDSEKYVEIISRNTEVSDSQVRDWMQNEVEMSPVELCRHGFVHGVILETEIITPADFIKPKQI